MVETLGLAKTPPSRATHGREPGWRAVPFLLHIPGPSEQAQLLPLHCPQSSCLGCVSALRPSINHLHSLLLLLFDLPPVHCHGSKA